MSSNLDTFIEYLRTVVKVKRNMMMSLGNSGSKEKDAEKRGMIIAYDSMLKELDECSDLIVDKNQDL